MLWRPGRPSSWEHLRAELVAGNDVVGRDPGVFRLRCNPRFDFLRDDPCMAQIERDAGLPQSVRWPRPETAIVLRSRPQESASLAQLARATDS